VLRRTGDVAGDGTHQENLVVFALVTLARFDAAQGRLDDAGEGVATAVEQADAVGADSINAYAAGVRGLASRRGDHPRTRRSSPMTPIKVRARPCSLA
jgi:hypothetical protein